MKELELSENDIKVTIRGYLRARNIFSFHNLQGLGCYPGVPDRTIVYHGRVIFVEVKKKGGKLNPSQELFRANCLAEGVEHLVVHSFEEFQERFEALG